MTTIVYLTGIPKHKPALKAHKNQCSLHRNINCLESLIKKNHVIFVSEHLFFFFYITASYSYIVSQWILVIGRNRITKVLLTEATDRKALIDIYTILKEYVWSLGNVAEIPWVPRSGTFLEDVLSQWCGPIIPALTLKLLIWDQYLAAVVWMCSQDHQ